jgi:hypothetical protein
MLIAPPLRKHPCSKNKTEQGCSARAGGGRALSAGSGSEVIFFSHRKPEIASPAPVGVSRGRFAPCSAIPRVFCILLTALPDSLPCRKPLNID